MSELAHDHDLVVCCACQGHLQQICVTEEVEELPCNKLAPHLQGGNEESGDKREDRGMLLNVLLNNLFCLETVYLTLFTLSQTCIVAYRQNNVICSHCKK